MIDLNSAAVTFVDHDGPVTVETVPDAEAWIARLGEEIQDIQTQLGLRNRCHADGRRMSGTEYWSWRDKATTALNHRRRALQRLKAFVRANRAQEFNIREAAREARDLLRGDHSASLDAIRILSSALGDEDLPAREGAA